MTRRATAALMAVLVVLMSFSPALADNTDSDGDGVAPYGDNSMAFGSVACGVATDKTAPVWVTRLGAAGNPQVFKDGSTVTISVLSVTGAGISAVMTGTTTITLPSDWGAQINGTQSARVTSTVTLNSSTAGAGSGVVNYRATGINSSGATITRDEGVSPRVVGIEQAFHC